MNFEKFFNPKSIAVVGASREKGKVGHEILASIIGAGYEGQVFPVNNKADEIEGLKCFPDLASTGQVPELVIIAVPAAAVPSVMQQCAGIGVQSVIIITAGFKEVGQEGSRLEKQVIQIARQAKIKVIGPNCLGVVVPANKLNASFGGQMPIDGGIGYISQSGAIMTAILDYAMANRIGFSKLVSIGNKADINELDVLEVLGQDANTKVIAGYLENITDGNAFVTQAERISRNKPILMIKSGGTAAGAKAATSHTGSLAGAETAYECVFERAGIIRCNSLQQQFDYAQAFAYQPLSAGSTVAVITNAGGPGIMAADDIERQGLEFATFSRETGDKLAEALPPAANISNPIDVLGDALADRYELAIEAVLEDPNVDVVLVLLTPQAMTEADSTAEAIVRQAQAKASRQKPIFTCFLGAEKVKKAKQILQQAKIPHYDSPEKAVCTIKAMTDYIRWRNRPKRVVKQFAVNRAKVENIIEKHLRQGIKEINEEQSKQILAAYGFATPEDAVADSAEKAVAVANRLGYPVVLKIWSPQIVHKTDVGGVKMDLNSDQEVMDAFDLMMYRVPQKAPDAEILGVLVQQMCKTGKEVILGMKRDRHFGPLMMFGLGGTMVEALKDVSFYLAPLTADEAMQMLMSTKTYRILTGFRGQEAVDMDSIAEALQRLSQLVTEFPEIQELDINPYVVGPPGTTPIAVDARMRVEKA
ncbi:MAG TPA: acetate--CoA ligase family protein [Sedimentisphaerales bacterium]|nr:acetate--CoA ligase family protein [Sedimentisphaerales bacterium]